jgi:hypothetical protein
MFYTLWQKAKKKKKILKKESCDYMLMLVWKKVNIINKKTRVMK